MPTGFIARRHGQAIAALLHDCAEDQGGAASLADVRTRRSFPTAPTPGPARSLLVYLASLGSRP
jgi:hypothetical protein